MAEDDHYGGFSIRRLIGGQLVAVLLPAAWAEATDEECGIFDERSLDLRVRNLLNGGHDAALSEAALHALRDAVAEAGSVAASAPPEAATVPAAAQGTYPPGLRLIGEALLQAARAARETLDHEPWLLLLTVRNLDWIAACRGEQAAEAALVNISERLADNLRRVDRLVRLDATRFSACLPSLPRGDAEAIADRLRHAVGAGPVELPDGPVALWLEVELLAAPRDRSLSPSALAAAMLLAAEHRLRQDRQGRATIDAA